MKLLIFTFVLAVTLMVNQGTMAMSHQHQGSDSSTSQTRQGRLGSGQRLGKADGESMTPSTAIIIVTKLAEKSGNAEENGTKSDSETSTEAAIDSKHSGSISPGHRRSARAAKLAGGIPVIQQDSLEDDDEDEADNVKPNDGVTEGPSASDELKTAVKVAVTNALNKLASALKNATEGSAAGCEDHEQESKPKVLPPCTITRKTNCTQHDILDEFFPPKPLAQTPPKKTKRHKRSNSFRSVPFAKLEVVEVEGEAEDSTAGGVLAIGTVQSGENADEKRPDDSQSTGSGATGIDQGLTGAGTNPEGIADASESTNTNSTMSDSSSGQNNPNPVVLNPSPKQKPGKCQPPHGNKGCISLGPDSSQCSKDGDCSGMKKCCFYACAPYQKVGICELSTLF